MALAFGSFDEIRDVGYGFGKNYFEYMAETGRLGRFNQWFNKKPPKRGNHASLNEYTFIDLAQIVCRLPSAEIFSEDEDSDGYISEPTTLNTDRRRIQVPRAGNFLCFSETEMDSDVEIDLKLVTTSIQSKEEATRHHHRYHRHRREDEAVAVVVAVVVAAAAAATTAEQAPHQQQSTAELGERCGLEQREHCLNKDDDKENRNRANNETKN
ncbi:hypothetical protein KR032_005278 [Drosophila birchii]|nr:hypothetical protein KR032_005278 [Drosophila birchii]